jgi:hypothetical protein
MPSCEQESPHSLASSLSPPLCRSAAAAADTFTIYENLHVGQKLTYTAAYDYTVKSTSTTNGVPTVADSEIGHTWKMALTIQAMKNGSAVQSLADVDPCCIDISRDAGGPQKKTPCPYAGKSVILIRLPNDSLLNNFSGTASDDDASFLNNFVTPDQQWYPAHPVAVGDTWDDSAATGKYSSLGPKDQCTSQGRLDWVKLVDGKQMAQMTHTMNITYHEDANVEEDVTVSITQLVDMASGVIVNADEKGSSKYKTPPTEAAQVTGGTEFTMHVEATQDAAGQP